MQIFRYLRRPQEAVGSTTAISHKSRFSSTSMWHSPAVVRGHPPPPCGFLPSLPGSRGSGLVGIWDCLRITQCIHSNALLFWLPLWLVGGDWKVISTTVCRIFISFWQCIKYLANIITQSSRPYIFTPARMYLGRSMSERMPSVFLCIWLY